ncbi:MAG: DUF4388 domain-containing protein [Candidatus Obscuribacterales bacterium]
MTNLSSQQPNSDVGSPIDETDGLAESSSKESGTYYPPNLSYRTYSYRENLFAEFDRLVAENKRFDGLIIDVSQTGFTLPIDALIKFHGYGKRLLKPQAVMLFIKADGAITLTKDDPGGGLTLNVYDSPFGIFARYPMLADYVCATVSGIDRRRLRGGGSTLANHILYTSTPVLTARGVEMKLSFDVPAPQNWLLQLIDDYSTTEAIIRAMEARHHVASDETLRMLQELEGDGVIYPIFSRIQFLANCYHNRKPFRLGRYMVAAGLVTPSQLEELLELQQDEGWGRNQKTFLGLLAVRRGYINMRELEVLLHDQYLYGGYHKTAEGENEETRKQTIESMRDSMIGSLGAIDSAGLLQSFATAKKTGLLTVENRDKAVVVQFEDGKATNAKLGKLSGYFALVEFLVTWTEGIFVFRDKGNTKDFDQNSKLNNVLEKILLDAALAQDNTATIINALPGGRNVILERVWNFDQLFLEVRHEPAKYFDDTPIPDEDKPRVLRIAQMVDGLTTLDEVIKQADDWPTHMVLKAVQWLIDHKLITVQQTSLFRPLTVFQRVAMELQEHIGVEHNKAILDASLQYVHGETPALQRFNIDREGRVSVNLAQVKSSGTPVSVVLIELRRWMEAYLAYCRRQCDPSLVDNIVASIVHTTT